jgi:Ran GTPase-activating protein (RanGAP) involved in mRNA processing and transport
MNLQSTFANALAEILKLGKHRFSRLDLHKNLLQDEGVKALMHEVHKSKSIVEVNFASNEISNEGMIAIF